MSEAPQSLIQSHNRWAVLIGVDQYDPSNLSNNLDGCVNDVELVHEFLRASLCVPDDHIEWCIAPNSDSTARDRSYLPPTKENVINTIQKIKGKTKPGDFVLIHFSGHGDRRPDPDDGNRQREFLCLLDTDLRDVEFGRLLQEMAAPPLQLTVLTSLDCCFSGGATRAKYHRVRRRPQSLNVLRAQSQVAPEIPDQANSQLGPTNIESTSRTLRQSKVADSYIFNDKSYNVITACLEFEEASEGLNCTTNKWYGALTFALSKCLKELGHYKSTTTYDILHGLLEASCNQLPDGKQQPQLYGDRDRVIFESFRYMKSQGLFLAHFDGFDSGDFLINRGRFGGVSKGDRYLLVQPGRGDISSQLLLDERDPELEVEISKVMDNSARARFCVGSSRDPATRFERIKLDWFLVRTRRGSPITVFVLHKDDLESKREACRVLEGWEKFVDSENPIDLQFSNITSKLSPEARFHVLLRDGVLRVLDSKRHPFNHFPEISVNNESLPKRLLALLAHLQIYISVYEHQPSSGVQQLQFKFELEDDRQNLEDNGAVGQWKIKFQNKHSTQLFLTVLSLSSYYGIEEVYPKQHGRGAPIDPGSSYEQPFQTFIPEYLEKDSRSDSFYMVDTIKAFVSNRQAALQHYELPDIGEAPLHNGRHTRTLDQASNWAVSCVEIETRRTGSGIKCSLITDS